MEIKEQLTLESLLAKQIIEKNKTIMSLVDELVLLRDRIEKMEIKDKPQAGPG